MIDSVQNSIGMLSVRGELNIYRAHELMQEFSAAIAECPSGTAIAIDLSMVTEFDTAGLQILLMMRRMVLAGGERLELLDPSDCVRDVLILCGADDLIATPANTGLQS